jgi:urease accessory protein
MKTDTVRMRAHRPFVFSNLKSGQGVEQIASFIIDKGGLPSSAA